MSETREQQARELHEAVERGCARWDKESQCGEPSCGCVTAYIELELEPVVARALAACARDEEKWWWENYNPEDGSAVIASHRIVALERAAGEGKS